MPELPEVETVCRGLRLQLNGQTVQQVIQRRPDLRFPLPDGFAVRLAGRTLTRLSRRAKYIVAEMDGPDVLVIHLGMSGRWILWSPEEGGMPQAGPHDHVELHMANGARAIFRDPRRFGYMDLIPATELERHPWFARLGPEPLGNAFHVDHLNTVLRGKRTPIKTALLDQRVVAGLGNIYVCEALYQASISPRRAAHTIPGSRAARLVPAIRDVLTRAIEKGGSTLRDYVRTDGQLGYFQHEFQVYGRAGQRCPCSGVSATGPCTVHRIVQSGRSTFYCPTTQR